MPLRRRFRANPPFSPVTAAAFLALAVFAAPIPEAGAACVEDPNPPIFAMVLPPCDGDGVPGDNLCDNDFGEHVVARPDVNAAAPVKDRLVIYLSGAGGRPAHSQNLLYTAASHGFRSIGVAYNTSGLSSQLQSACQIYTTEPAAQDCYAEGRHRAAFGVTGAHTTSPPPIFYSTSIHDAVEVRLRRLLIQLDVQDPAGDWDDFLDAGGCTNLVPENEAVAECETDVLWHKLIVVGWSGGAGVGQHLGQDVRLHGVVMLDGVADRYSPMGGGVAVATIAQGLTGDDIWTVVHDQNNAAGGRPAEMRNQWNALGVPILGSGELRLDATACGGASQKGTSVETRRFFVESPCFPADVHASVAVDDHMIVDNDLCGACTTAAPNTPTGNYELHNAYAHILCRAEKCGGGALCP
ncbi:MAG: hypothetical protein AAGF23_10790 [Acidobacteriota bacterium]